MFAPVGEGKKELEDSLSGKTDELTGKVDEAEVSNKADEAEGQAKDGEEITARRQADAETAPKEGKGEAYENGKIADIDSLTQKQEILNVENGTTPLEGYEGHKQGNHTRKGNYGEMKMDQHMEGIQEINGKPADLSSLHDRITNIDETGHHGIDGVYENATPPPKYIISESKYGSSDLNPNTKDGPQMSDDWIKGSDRLENAVGTEVADDIRFELENNPDNVQKVLTHVDENGNVTTSTIDSDGNITGPWPQ